MAYTTQRDVEKIPKEPALVAGMRTRAFVQEKEAKQLCELQRLLGIKMQGENPYLISTVVKFLRRK